LAAGANTLGGNFAAAGNAGDTALGQEGQGDLAQANLANQNAEQQNNGLVGQALADESQQVGQWSQQSLQQDSAHLSDILSEVQQRAQFATKDQQDKISAAVSSVQNAQQAYEEAVKANSTDQAKLLNGLKLALGVLAVAGGAVLTATGGGSAAGAGLIVAGGTSAVAGATGLYSNYSGK
jgi:hypothetical protein